MRQAKYNRIIKVAEYHTGPATVAHVLSTVTNDPDICALPSRIIGKIANIRHRAYLEGRQSQAIDTWDYDTHNDFLAGLPDGKILKVDPNKIVIEDKEGKVLCEYVLTTMSRLKAVQ